MKTKNMKIASQFFSRGSQVAACLFFLFFFGIVHAQVEKVSKEQLKELKEVKSYLSMANEELGKDNFPEAEVNYRKSIAIDPREEIGKYNLGNAYYNKAKNDEAMRRFTQAAAVSESKTERHKAFHNLGNTFMNAKMYQEAVEAYKDALRNNPKDDETRYNLALAKEMLEKNPPQGGDGEDENKEQNENQDEKNENSENKEDEGKNKESDEGEDKEDEGKGDEKDEEQEGDNKQEQGKPEDQKEKEQPKQQPVPGQLSPQQIKNLLEAMNNEEKKVQDKINAKKQKGAKVKSKKDW
jgi:Ca-activated chloride channel family protein